MSILKLTIEYDGSDFNGWQRQPQGCSVQETLEKIITRIIISQSKKENKELDSNYYCKIEGSGRTDAGVHALGQVAHFTWPNQLSLDEGLLRFQINGSLLKRASILSVEKVSDDFHSRKSCHSKTYEYRVLNRAAPPTIQKDFCWHIRGNLKFEAMQTACIYLLGEHDFTQFKASDCNAKTSNRTIFESSIFINDDMINYRVTGNGFLKHQVRFIVGALIAIGQGKFEPEVIHEMLIGSKRPQYTLAPACGLYLLNVNYC